jgi:hypothetical protein
LQLTKTTGFPVTQPVTYGKRVGSFLPMQITFAAANTDTTFTVGLDRLVSVVQVIENQQGGIVYNGSNQRADWGLTASGQNQVVLRATVAGTYGVAFG